VDIKTVVPIENVGKRPVYHEIDVTTWDNHHSYSTGRLCIFHLTYGISCLIANWYRAKGNFSIQVHLVIPPELILIAMDIFRKDKIGDDFIQHLVEKVWIDPYIETSYPNCPWYLFVSPDLVVGDKIDLDGTFYSFGRVP
jgi:hypothetical protein